MSVVLRIASMLLILIIFVIHVSSDDDDVLRDDVRKRAQDVRMMLRNGAATSVDDVLQTYLKVFEDEKQHECDACLIAAIQKTLNRCDVALSFFNNCDAERCYDLIQLDPARVRIHSSHCYEIIGRHDLALPILSNVLIRHIEKKEKINDMMVRLIVQRIVLVRRALGKPSSSTEAFFHHAIRTLRLPYETSYQIPLEYDIMFQNAVPWHDVQSNRIAMILEENADQILKEFEKALCDEIAFDFAFDRDLVKGKSKDGWGKYNLMRNGIWNSKRCVETFPFVCSLLRDAPELSNLFEGEVAFLKLKRGVNLLPHFGPTNTRLTVHLGLMTPFEGVRLRVGNETRRQVALKSLVFDDSFEHEVTWDDENTPAENQEACHKCNSEGSRYILSLHTHNRNRNLFS